MKTLILSLVTLLLFACNKPEVEKPKYDKPVDVIYTVTGRNNIPKHITARLWACDQHGASYKLVGVIDTVIIGSGSVRLVQNEKPYIYCKVSCEVECVPGDTMSLSIGSAGKEYLYRSGSCLSNYMAFSNEFLTLYE